MQESCFNVDVFLIYSVFHCLGLKLVKENGPHSTVHDHLIMHADVFGTARSSGQMELLTYLKIIIF